MSAFVPPALDWQPALPDLRDYSLQHEQVQALLQPLRRRAGASLRRTRVDLREYFPPVADSGSLHWSSAHACVSMIEYFERRAYGRLTPRSAAFVYKMSRKLLQKAGDSGADLRTTLKAIRRFGIPPAQYWPDHPGCFDHEPEAFLYSLADSYRNMLFVRVDGPDVASGQTLETIRALLSAGFPCALGFSVPESISAEADIPWRPTFDSVLGGQVVVVSGYDDTRLRSTKGALLIRNSWGSTWGEDGYGWLPYRYIEQQLAGDCWTLLCDSWLASDEFLQPAIEDVIEERT